MSLTTANDVAWTQKSRHFFRNLFPTHLNTPRYGTAKSWKSSAFDFLRNRHAASYNICTNLHSHQLYRGLCISPHPCQNFVFCFYIWCEHAHMPGHEQGSQLSPSTMWVQDLAWVTGLDDKHVHPLSHHAGLVVCEHPLCISELYFRATKWLSSQYESSSISCVVCLFLFELFISAGWGSLLVLCAAGNFSPVCVFPHLEQKALILTSSDVSLLLPLLIFLPSPSPLLLSERESQAGLELTR